MKKFFKILSYAIIPVLLLVLMFRSNDSGVPEIIHVNPEYAKYVLAYTSGVISNKSDIVIELKEELSNDEIEKINIEELFEFNPHIDGDVSWIDNRTIQFSPSEDLESLQMYTATFHLSKVVVVPSDMLDFKFQFQSKYMDLSIYIEGLSPYSDDMKWQKINGVLTTTDNVSEEMIERLVDAKQRGKELKISWVHSEGSFTHNFVIDSVIRSDSKEVVNVYWDGDLIGVDNEGELQYEIPPLGDFNVMDIEVSQLPDQYIKVRFSDPLSKDVMLDGLIYLESREELSWSVNKNFLTVYPKNKLVGTKKIIISNNIKNSNGYELNKEYSEEIEFVSMNPQIELIGDGVILPSTNGLIFPFRSVNLTGVNVKVIRIYEDNVSQFFQSNNFDGRYSLTRVGRIIFKDDIKLKSDKKVDLGDWNTFSLDLSDMIKTEPGAIYRIMLSFKMSQSLYPCDCGDSSELERGIEYEDDMFEVNSRYWYSDENYNYGNSYYSYSEREDPCKIAYYSRSDNTVVKNVFASDFGIIVKGNEDGGFKTIVTDLISTTPQSGVKIELYNYQNRLISSKTTNNNGVANFDIDKKPFLLVAKRGKEIGYLKLDDGSALSMSMFDVGGTETQDGIKGFMYGDRGVWRPGDSLFITFILEDKQKTLPSNHPVVFTLYNAKGQIHKRITSTVGKNGFYVFKTKTNTDSETGNWEATIKVGDANFLKRIKIETIKPNRLKVDLYFGGKILTNLKSNRVKLTSNWLHGAPAKGLKTNIEINLSETITRFEGYSSYNFDDYIKSFKSQDLDPIEPVLNDEGKTTFSPPFKTEGKAPGMLRASFKTRIFEKGGDASVDRILIPYSPYRSYVGFDMPEGSSWNRALYSEDKNPIPIATIDEFGKSVDRDNVKIEIFEISWNWWWQSSSKHEVSQYVTGSYKKLIHTDYINTKKGNAIYELDLDKEIYGRYYIRITDPVSNHSSGEVFYMSYKSYWNSSEKSEGAEMLVFDTDKKSYNVGEEVRINLPESKEGRVLVSIESGENVIKTFWYKASKTRNDIRFKTTSDMAPNIYLNLTFIQPHKHTENDLPIRMYGIKGISVEDPNTHLNPMIKMDDELQPEEKVTIRVSEENGKRMTYTIAVVDDGLLDLTHFRTPQAWNIFYARQSLGIKTWDMYKYVNGAISGEFAGLLQIGGDEYKTSEDKKKANRFKPVVKFLGPFTLTQGRTAKHSFKMPNYVGSVRTMVIAGYDGAYGSSEKTTPVRKPLMVLSSLPRVLGPSEEVELPVTVFAMKDNIKEVTVKVQVNDKFDVVGSSIKKITFNELGDQVVNFRLKVKDKLGIGTVKVRCTSGKEIASHEVELDVRMPNPEITKVTSKVLASGDSWNTDFKTFGINGTNSAVLELSTIPPINLEKRLNYLIQYPHGCIEQTTSAVFPQLYLNDLMDLDNNQLKEVQKNIKKALLKYNSFQTSSGGFSYWPSYSDYVDQWGTNYAGHFIIEAKNKGYKIPIGLLENWTRYQTSKANEWYFDKSRSSYYQRSSQLQQSYRLYTLALSGKPALSAMNKMRNYSKLSNLSRWRLASAYLLIGRKDVAEDLIAGLSHSIDEYNGSSLTYGSKIRDKSIILEVLTLLKDYDECKEVMDIIANELASENYMNTQTTAYSLMAISKFVSFSGSAKSFTFDYNSESNKTESAFHQINLEVLSNNRNIKLKNTSENLLFASLQIKGIPMYDGKPMNEDNKIKMEIKYFSIDHLPLNPEKIEQGTDFYVEAKITNIGKYDYENIALSQLFPSGWEIRNTRMDLVEEKGGSNITYQDIRDDRVYSYFNVDQNKTIIVKIQLNASYLGKFYLPIVNCEDMYNHSVNAKEGGRWVEVIE